MPDKSTDAQLLERANRGDEEAFLVLYRGHRDTVFRFAYRLIGSIDAAEDITQDCFLSALRHPERFDERRASLRTYLCAAARNLAMKYFRRAGREIALEETPEDFVYGHGTTEQPLGKLLNEELSETVRRAVAQLPPLQREALVLFEYEEFTLVEIAAITGADTGTIKARLYRAREGLRRTLAPYFKAHEAAEALEKR